MAEMEDWQILLALFPPEWQQLGRSSGAVKRLRGFPSLEALLRTLLLHVGCGWSLRETAVQAKLAGIAAVSDVTLLNRLRDAEDWLRQLCQQLWKDNGVDLQPSLYGRSVRLLDATVVKEPGKTGSQWRIHYSLRLPTLECDYFHLTATRGVGSAERFGHFRFRAGEVVLADAGYCHPVGIAGVVQQQAEVCVRMNPHALPLWDERGRPFSLLEPLAGLRQTGELAEWPVWIHAGLRRSRWTGLCHSQEPGGDRAGSGPTEAKAATGKECGAGNSEIRPVCAGLHHASGFGGQRRTNPGGLSAAMASRADLQTHEVHRTDWTCAETR
jgi:hypothetical protein